MPDVPRPVDPVPSERAAGGLEADHLELSRNLRRLARRLVVDDATADDLVQEAWLAALERPRGAVRELNSWLHQVVRNVAARRRRKADRRESAERFSAPTEIVPSETELVDRLSTYRLLRDTTAELREPYRTVLRMRFFEERAVDEIAVELGRPLDTVKTQVRRGLAELREALDRKHHGERSVWAAALVRVAAEGGTAELTSAAVTSTAPGWVGALLVAILFAGIPLTWWWTQRDEAEPELALARPPSESPADEATAGAAVDSVTPPRELAPAAPARTGPTDTEADASTAPRETPEDLAPAPARTRPVDVTVLRSNGTPAGEAIVRIVGRGGEVYGVFESDDEGRVHVDMPVAELVGPPQFLAGGGLGVSGRALDQAWSFEYELPVPEEGASIELRSRGRAQTVRGRVLDEDGAPVERAFVSARRHVMSTNETADGIVYAERVDVAWTDAGGRFELAGLRRRTHRLVVTAQHFRTEERAVRGKGDVIEEDVVLSRGTVLFGEVRHTDGRPASGAYVWLGRIEGQGDGGPEVRTVADVDGGFVLQGLAGGGVRVFTCDPVDRELADYAFVALPERGEVAWNGVLEPEPGVSVLVLDHDGEPLRGAMVGLALAPLPSWGETEPTDSAGRAHFPHVPDEPLVLAVTRAPGDARIAHLSMGIVSGPDEVVVTLEADTQPATVRGVLLGHDGSPLGAGAQASIVAVAGDEETRLRWFEAAVDESTGAFRGEDVVPDRYDVWAIVDGRGTMSLGRHAVLAGEEYDLGTRTAQAPGVFEPVWTTEPPTAEAHWVIVPDFPFAMFDGRAVLVLEGPIEAVELLPGPFRIRREEHPLGTGWEFEIRSGETYVGTITEPTERRPRLRSDPTGK